MEGAHEGGQGRDREEPLRPLAHLRGGLVGEGHGGDRARVHSASDQVRESMRDHPRLARPRAGENQKGTLPMQHRFALLRIETF